MTTSTRQLTSQQISQFEEQGFLVLEQAIPAEALDALRKEFSDWVAESQNHREPYGMTVDGRPRFDVEPGHSADRPALRRVSSPVEISDTYLGFMRDNPALNAVTDLLGPNIRFENAKVNSKLPGAATEVRFHQDFLFEPHTNDDLITVLFYLDDMTADNGALEVIPGSHRGVLYDHWQDGVFTGAVADENIAALRDRAVPCYGMAGSACLMHTRLLHGSGPNLSDATRTLYICTYSAEDAHPLQDNHIPSRYMYEVVRGEDTGRVRCSSYQMKFPELPTEASFFQQQAKAGMS